MMHESAKMIEVVMKLIQVAEDLVEGKRSPQDRRADASAVLSQIPILWPRKEYDIASAMETYEKLQGGRQEGKTKEMNKLFEKHMRPAAEVEEEYGLPKGYLTPEGDDNGS